MRHVGAGSFKFGPQGGLDKRAAGGAGCVAPVLRSPTAAAAAAPLNSSRSSGAPGMAQSAKSKPGTTTHETRAQAGGRAAPDAAASAAAGTKQPKTVPPGTRCVKGPVGCCPSTVLRTPASPPDSAGGTSSMTLIGQPECQNHSSSDLRLHAVIVCHWPNVRRGDKRSEDTRNRTDEESTFRLQAGGT